VGEVVGLTVLRASFGWRLCGVRLCGFDAEGSSVSFCARVG
jgi:hypothetical protein